MRTVLASVLVFSATTFFLGDIGIAAPTNKVTSKSAAGMTVTHKPSSTDILIGQLFLNKYGASENLSSICKRADFKYLAIALGMNIDLLTHEKGEFETSEQYKQRSDKLAEILSSDPIALCVSPDIITSFSYHADEKIFEGSLGDTLNVLRDVKQLRSYRSKTRMGASATVKSALVMEYNAALSFPSYPYGCLSGEYNHTFHVPYGRDDAPTLKSIGRIVLLAKLEPPYVGKEDTRGSPTLDNPYDIYTREITVHLKLEKLIVADYRGNEIWSCRVGALPPLQLPKPEGDISNWVRIVDYPDSVHREQLAARTVSAVLEVGANGNVIGCKVVSSSGSTELDQATCMAWTKRAKFIPASDKDGNPTTSEYAISKTWSRFGF